MSASESELLPARGGIAPFPLITDATSASVPVAMRGAYAALSPNFGGIAVWQTAHALV